MSDDIKYEEAIKQLEEIVLKLENGSASLDESISLFEKEQSLQVFAVISLNPHSKKSLC